MLVEFGRSRRMSGQICRTSAETRLRRNCSTALGRLFGNVCDTPELAGVHFSGLNGEQLETIFGKPDSVCHARPLQGLRHHSPDFHGDDLCAGLRPALRTSGGAALEDVVHKCKATPERGSFGLLAGVGRSRLGVRPKLFPARISAKKPVRGSRAGLAVLG